MKIIILLALASLSSTVFSAGSVNDFTVTTVRVDRSGLGIITFEGSLGGTPASCISSSYHNHLSFDTNTTGGKAILSIALSAQATGKKVSARGTGNCEDYGSVESWSFGNINNN